MILLSIQGMTCPSCVGHVKEALDAIEGVINVEVSYKNANAAITANAGVSVADLVGAIEALGYTAKENTSPSAYGENTTTSDTGGNRSQQVVIIGSGSAAFACAIKAAERGAKVTLIEGADVIGGCCVNVGCVPKKLYVYASEYGKGFADARGFGWGSDKAPFEWATLRDNKKTEISRLNDIYRGLLGGVDAQIIDGRGRIVEYRKESPVLVMGDSFVWIYSAEGADLARQLHRFTGMSMDVIAIPGGAALGCRTSLARRKGGPRDKRMVIWLWASECVMMIPEKWEKVDVFARR